jgi:hypothetical protein
MAVKLVYEQEKMHEPYSCVKSVEMELQTEASLDEMLTAYGEFLKALGYGIDGQIIIEKYAENS